jgi:predicted lipid-binding transport protein (Tim44 family)
MRRLLAALAALELLAPASALAGPGGGSSGFSGGGGGGGGGGFSGGGGGYGGGGSGGGGSLVFTLLVLAVVAFVVLRSLRAQRAARRGPRPSRRRAARVREVELAAASAAADDEAFDADAVRAAAADLYRETVAAWTARDRVRLASLLGRDLMVEWRRRLEDFDRKGWHNVTEILDGPYVDYVGLTNRAGEAEDRVVVHIGAVTRDVVDDREGNTITHSGSRSETTQVAEYWTLGRRDGRWVLLSIEQDAEGAHQLGAPLIATPSDDDERLRGASVTELAAADAVPAAALAEITPVDMDGDARAAALDLSLVDGRFAPEVLEVAARRAVEAWAEAVDGADAPLEAIADPAAVAALLYPGDPSRRTRLVVRGPRLEALRITGIAQGTMTVRAEVRGRRYREDRDTLALVEGSRDRETRFTETWTLRLGDDAGTPWRIAAA